MINFNKKNYLLLFIKTSVLLLSCYLIYKNINIEKNFFSIFYELDFKYFFIVLIITFILAHLQIFVQLKSFFQIKKNFINFSEYAKIFFNGQMISFILPHSGTIYKAYKLKKFNFSYKDFIGINLFLTWFYLFFFIIFYSFEILIFGNEILKDYYIILFLVGILFATTILLIPFIYEKFFKIKFKNILVSKIYNTITYIVMLPINLKNYQFYKLLSLCGLIGHILSFIIIYLLFLTIGIDLKFSVIIIFFIVNSFLDQVPITPKNLAISELIFGIVSQNIGLTFEFGVVIKLLLRLFFFINLVTLTIFYNAIDLKNNEK